MASADSTAEERARQPRNGYGFLESLLDGIDDAPLIAALESYHPTGRPGYPPRSMWRAYLIKFLLKIRYNNQLLERLRGSRRLREVCGFGDSVPSESALSRFITRLKDHTESVEQALISATEEVRGLLPAIKEAKDGSEEALPPLGDVVAIDGSVFPSYSNPNRTVVSDPDARWGVKHSSKAKDGDTEWMWGYRMHLLSDVTHGIPLDFIVTPANTSEFDLLPLVVGKALETYDWLQPQYLLGDRGYDSLAIHETLIALGITPIIHIRKATAGDGLYDGVYAKDGYPVCLSTEAMEYVRTDPQTGHHLFRCRAEGCPLQERNYGMHHCDGELWVDPEENPRVIGMIPRFTGKWKYLYSQRMSIERTFRSLKHSRGLEQHCVRGMKGIQLHATMSLLTYQATVLARLKAGDTKTFRHMTVKVA